MLTPQAFRKDFEEAFKDDSCEEICAFCWEPPNLREVGLNDRAWNADGIGDEVVSMDDKSQTENTMVRISINSIQLLNCPFYVGFLLGIVDA